MTTGFTADELSVVSGRLGRRLVSARSLTGGYRNVNVLATAADDTRYVLRRYADGAVCGLEAALAERLRGTGVPVPEVVVADPTGTLLGDPLLVSRYVPGIGGDRVLATGSGSDAAGLGCAMGTALDEIGTVRFARPGFLGADLDVRGGPPATGLAGYVARELPASNAALAFTPAELTALCALAEREAPLVETVSAAAHLVHGDYNPKNVLAERDGDGWRLTAVLDWEFALCATPMFDVGNALRFAAHRPPGFADGFITGYERAGGVLVPEWRAVSRAVDLFALVGFLAQPPDHRYFRKSVALLRSRL